MSKSQNKLLQTTKEKINALEMTIKIRALNIREYVVSTSLHLRRANGTILVNKIEVSLQFKRRKLIATNELLRSYTHYVSMSQPERAELDTEIISIFALMMHFNILPLKSKTQPSTRNILTHLLVFSFQLRLGLLVFIFPTRIYMMKPKTLIN